MATDSRGVLYVIGTPLGNLEDLSARARRVLAEVDLIAAEDTRRTRGLLSSIGLNRPLIAYHEHNEARRTASLVAELQSGKSIALVSDAGTPLISDPGYRLVSAALAADVHAVSVPGPSAVTAALSISGLPAERFVFEGFLPRRTGARRERLEALRSEPRTLVFFEAVHRIVATLADLVEVFGAERRAALARELTKVHESLVSGTLAEIGAGLGAGIPLKGEFVLVVAGSGEAQGGADRAEARRVFDLLHHELPAAAAAKLAAKITGVPRNEIYRLGGEEPT
jgi:16S rRNA (cytidine1402-2'-O)-methyltransferase